VKESNRNPKRPDQGSENALCEHSSMLAETFGHGHNPMRFHNLQRIEVYKTVDEYQENGRKKRRPKVAMPPLPLSFTQTDMQST